MKILVTGAAGFIGAFLCKKLLETTNNQIIGVDNLNDYYDVNIKYYRLQEIDKLSNVSKNGWRFVKGSIADKSLLNRRKEDVFE